MGGNSYCVQKGRWCDMDIANVHVAAEGKIDDTRITEPTSCIQQILYPPDAYYFRRFQCKSYFQTGS